MSSATQLSDTAVCPLLTFTRATHENLRLKEVFSSLEFQIELEKDRLIITLEFNKVPFCSALFAPVMSIQKL